MAKPTRAYNQQNNTAKCEEGLSNDFFGENCTPKMICEALTEIFARHPDKTIYVGVTYHPCGRFTGDYTNTDPLPDKFNFPHIVSLNNAIDINEARHYLTYEIMYVICFTQDYDEIIRMENSAIECARNIDSNRVGNSPNSRGGEGIRPGLGYYFLYACVSKDISS